MKHTADFKLSLNICFSFWIQFKNGQFSWLDLICTTPAHQTLWFPKIEPVIKRSNKSCRFKNHSNLFKKG